MQTMFFQNCHFGFLIKKEAQNKPLNDHINIWKTDSLIFNLFVLKYIHVNFWDLEIFRQKTSTKYFFCFKFVEFFFAYVSEYLKKILEKSNRRKIMMYAPIIMTFFFHSFQMILRTNKKFIEKIIREGFEKIYGIWLLCPNIIQMSVPDSSNYHCYRRNNIKKLGNSFLYVSEHRVS